MTDETKIIIDGTEYVVTSEDTGDDPIIITDAVQASDIIVLEGDEGYRVLSIMKK